MLTPLVLTLLGAAIGGCNGRIETAAEGAGPPVAAPPGAGIAPAATPPACIALGEQPTRVLDDAPGSGVASDGQHLYFMRRDDDSGRASLVRAALTPGAAVETVVASNDRTGPAGFAAGPGRVAFTRGEVVEGPYGERVEPRDVLLLGPGKREPSLIHRASPEARIAQLVVSAAGDVLFTEQGAKDTTLFRWYEGALETVARFPASTLVMALPDVSSPAVYVVIAEEPPVDGPGEMTIARIASAGAAREAVATFPASRKLWGLTLVGSDAESLYFTSYSTSRGMDLRRVAKSGGEDELMIPAAWALSAVLVDERPSAVVATADAIFLQPKDLSQRTTLATAAAGGGMADVTVDACNVYWRTFDPPALMGRRR